MGLFGAAPGVALALAGLLSLPASAEEGVESRRVLALFDGEGRSLRFDFEDPVHQVLEMPLNHLGMVVERHDIRKGPPPDSALDGTRALLTLFDNRGDCPPWLWPWLEEKVRDRGLRVVHVGDFGPLTRPGGASDFSRLEAWLGPLGLSIDDRYLEGPVGIGTDFLDRRLCAFESNPLGRAIHRGPKNRSPRNRAWVRTWPAGDPEDVRAPVVTGPWGGIALDPWTYNAGDENEERRWYLDPFAFFREALGLEGVPAPHPSVLHGRRMFFLHVDGDGFEDLSSVKPGALSAEVFREEILERYPLPFTVSIIVASLTKDLRVAEPTREMEEARRIFRLANVEPASHGVLHPLRWDLPLRSAAHGDQAWYANGLANYEYGAVNEVRDSIRFVNERLLEGRRCGLMLWTGSTNAPEEAVLQCAREGALNLNGGVFRWDPLFDSSAFVSPWARRIGSAVQVYAGACNENDFEGFFREMPGAYGHIDETIERTGRDRILKPANLYVHFYIADKPARLRPLHALVRRWAYGERTIPVFASVYVRSVLSALGGCEVRRCEKGFEFRGFGDCRTARIDGPTPPIDWERSPGLFGARRVGDSLYLDLAGPDARVSFAPGAPPHPHLEESDHPLTETRREARSLSCVSHGFAARSLVLGGFAPGAAAQVQVDGRSWRAFADAEGRIIVQVKEKGAVPVEVRLP
jgi:hypothetical protein